MTTHRFNTSNGFYTLRMIATGRQDHYGHEKVSYCFKNPAHATIFQGDDFGASPLHSATGKNAAIALLGFLTLQRGDTDADYFEKYTPEQLAFSESNDCEELQLIVYDFEN